MHNRAFESFFFDSRFLSAESRCVSGESSIGLVSSIIQAFNSILVVCFDSKFFSQCFSLLETDLF